MGLIPAGAYNNRNFRGAFVEFGPSVSQRVQDLLLRLADRSKGQGGV